jgi:hypothetical protein
MLDWRSLISLSDAELSRLDIAAVNLACAQGLPGAERIDVNRCLATIDYWTGTVKKWTDAAYFDYFLTNPAEFQHSEPRFRLMAMMTALGRHCGVKYDPSKIGAGPEVPFEFHEEFIHGIIQGSGGTCATLPVLSAAIGRRLGYPIRLAKTKQHLFGRWQEPHSNEYLNFEGAGAGFAFDPDDWYRKWPKPVTPDEEQAYCYLQSLTPRQELALFLGHRGWRWQDAYQFWNALEAFALAGELSPRDATYPSCIFGCMHQWKTQLQSQYPPGFPRRVEVLLRPDRRRWPAMPWEVEREIAALDSTEFCLHEPDHVKWWWEPLRNGKPPLREVPTSMTVDYEQVRPYPKELEPPCPTVQTWDVFCDPTPSASRRG